MRKRRYKKTDKKIFSALSTKRKIVCVGFALVLIVVLLVSATLSWFTVSDKALIDTNFFNIKAGSDLHVTDDDQITNTITLDKITLDEASSVDGRNMFFPTKGTFSSNTAEMVFREGNAGDKGGNKSDDNANAKYWAKKFTLSGGSAETNIYVKSYNVTVGDTVFNGATKINYDAKGFPSSQEKPKKCPIRIAFITDSSEQPIVVDPTALVHDYVNHYNAVASIDRTTGKVKTTDALFKKDAVNSFSDYYYGQTPIFQLTGNTSLDVTMVVWLEGTDYVTYNPEKPNEPITVVNNCQDYVGQEVSVDVEFESNWENMEKIEFFDDTIGDTDTNVKQWVYNPDDPALILMSYKENNTYKYTVMHEDKAIKAYDGKDGHIVSWYAYLPDSSITDIAFYRYDIGDATIFNAWYTMKGVNEQVKNTTAQGWIENHKLEEDRYDETSHARYRKYTATRGNGYGSTDVDSERLAPCIGYWSDPTYGQTEPPTELETEPPTTDPVNPGDDLKDFNLSGNCAVEIGIDVQDLNLREKFKNEEYTLYAVLYYNGTSYKLKLPWNNDSKCYAKADMPNGTQILSLRRYSASGDYITIALNNQQVFTGSYYYNKNLNKEGTAITG